jgi:hypothetical protein
LDKRAGVSVQGRGELPREVGVSLYPLI